MKRAGGYRIGFLQFLSIWKKQVNIKLFIHVHIKWVENNRHFLHFQFLIRRIQQILHWTITAALPQKISHTMMINYPWNPYDKNDSRLWRWWYQKISHTMMINYPRNPYDGNDSRSWRWKYHGNRRRFWEKREFIQRQRVLYFIFDRWCVIINVSFRIQSGVLCFWTRLSKIFTK